MKAPQFYVTLAIGALCLVLSLASIVLGKTNNALQQQQQQQQDEVNRGNMSLQIGQNMVRDMAELSLKNDKIKQLLSRSGYAVSSTPAASPSATPAASPAK